MTQTNNAATAAPPRPWWRHGMVWMVIMGPVVVVVAGIVTAVIAYRGADPVVSERPAVHAPIDTQPAMAGRNHAATGMVPGTRDAAAQR